MAEEVRPLPPGNYVLVLESIFLHIDEDSDACIHCRAVVVAPKEYAGRKIGSTLSGVAQEEEGE